MSLGKKMVGALRAPGVAWSFSRLGLRRRARRFDSTHIPESLAGRRFAITGANGGIGFAIAEGLVRRDADVVLLCRSRERGQHTLEQLSPLGSGSVALVVVDMSDMDSIDAAVDPIGPGRLDALIHNAGALVHEHQRVTGDLELTFACHVVGPARLTRHLRPALAKAADARVIFVSSGGMYSERLNVDELLDPPRPFDGVRAYALAKRAQVVLAEMWAQSTPEVRFYAMHPGWVDTPGVETALPRFYRSTKRWLRTPAEGADTALWLATNPALEVPSGGFVFDRRPVSRHILPGTRAAETERQRLYDFVDSLAARSLSADILAG